MEEINNELVFFGCSHTDIPDWESHINLKNYKYTKLSESGASNELILNKLKNWIVENSKKYNNKILVIQFSYLNRKRFYFEPINKFLNMHGIGSINKNTIIDGVPIGAEFAKILKNFYQNWIYYFFNYKTEFENLLLELKILKQLFEKENIKYIWYLWDGINNDELKFYNLLPKNINKEIDIDKFSLDKLNLVKFEETFFANSFAEKNKLRNCDKFNTDDLHLSYEGITIFANIIKNKILEKNEIDY